MSLSNLLTRNQDDSSIYDISCRELLATEIIAGSIDASSIGNLENLSTNIQVSGATNAPFNVNLLYKRVGGIAQISLAQISIAAINQVNSNIILSALPAGYRPAITSSFPIHTKLADNSEAIGIWKIATDGTSIIQQTPGVAYATGGNGMGTVDACQVSFLVPLA